MSEQTDIVHSLLQDVPPASDLPIEADSAVTQSPQGNPQYALKITLSKSFRDGDVAGPFFYDYYQIPEVSRAEVHRVIKDFRARVLIGASLRGKNKPSWEHDDGKVLPCTESYQELNYWHYHCGPNWQSSPHFSPTYGLQRNIYGDTSAEVIHYRKVLDEAGEVSEVVIVGYSPKHIPFLPSDDPRQQNAYFPLAEDE